MLGLGRYLLGVAEILLLGGFAWLGGMALCRRLLPRFEGAPAHLVSAVIALALLIWGAELLGTFGWWDPVPYLVLVAVAGLVLWKFAPRPEPQEGRPHPYLLGGVGTTLLRRDRRGWVTLIALAIAAIAVLNFALEAKGKLCTGMTGFDSTWYHGPFAAGFMQSGNTWDLHFIAPQFLAWFYPANGEIFHAAGMLAFGRDVLSPLLNVGWFVGCLLACWCIGRPYRVAPWSLALGAVALSVPALADQAGEARNDIVGIFFLLAGIAIALNAWGGDAGDSGTKKRLGREEGGAGVGAYLVVGLAAGLAAGTKLNFLLPAAVLVFGMGLVAPGGLKGRAVGLGAIGALAGGGYWYLRNLAHSGNPLPWVHHLPIDLPAPEQALGGREAHSVLGYLGDGSVWSDWFLPGLHSGLWILWPLLLLAALAGLTLAAIQVQGAFASQEDGKAPWRDVVLGIAGLVGLAAALAWLVAPTSASGPDGMPRGFESGLRYLAPALVLGLTLLPTALSPLAPEQKVRRTFVPDSDTKVRRTLGFGGRGIVLGALVLVIVAIGYPVQRHYLERRYSDPSFTAPGLNAAFAWARDISDARIATTSTRQYPLFGRDLSNEVDYVGEEQPHGGFTAPTTCRRWRELLNTGNYDYVVTSRDRIEPGKPTYPATARWTQAPNTTVALRTPPTVVYKLRTPLDPSACR